MKFNTRWTVGDIIVVTRRFQHHKVGQTGKIVDFKSTIGGADFYLVEINGKRHWADFWCIQKTTKLEQVLK